MGALVSAVRAGYPTCDCGVDDSIAGEKSVNPELIGLLHKVAESEHVGSSFQAGGSALQVAEVSVTLQPDTHAGTPCSVSK